MKKPKPHPCSTKISVDLGGGPGEYLMFLHPKDPRIRRSKAQRKLKESHVQMLIEAYDRKKVGVVTMVEGPDGLLYSGDGQHRLETVNRLIDMGRLDKDTTVLCRVLPTPDGMSPHAYAAEIYAAITIDGVLPPLPVDKYNLALQQSKPYAVVVNRVVRAARYNIIGATRLDKTVPATSTVTFVSSLCQWASRDPGLFEKAFMACAEIYAGESMHVNVFKGVIGAACVGVLRNGKHEDVLSPANVDRLVEAGARRIKQAIYDVARADAVDIGGTTINTPALAVLGLLNKGRRGKNRFTIKTIKKLQEIEEGEDDDDAPGAVKEVIEEAPE